MGISGENVMKTGIKNIKITHIVIILFVSLFSFYLGSYTCYNVNQVNKGSIIIRTDEADLRTSGDVSVPDGIQADEVNEADDPIIHLKMLQKDVETFRALMEEVKNELFVTKT